MNRSDVQWIDVDRVAIFFGVRRRNPVRRIPKGFRPPAQGCAAVAPKRRYGAPRRRKAALPRTVNFGMVRQEKLSRIEGESPSRLNMHDNTKT